VIQEFKDFLFRGNIIELAVAFVMGVAFAALVNSLVDDGAFITDVIQFLAIGAAVFFFIVTPVQAMAARRQKTPVEEGMPDEERRHQELLAALGQVGSR
jgi:large conductance mechanosensitive channel